MAEELAPLEDWIGRLLEGLVPAQRARALRRLATTLRRSQAQRIAAQQNPDGSAFAPRKPQETQRRLRADRGRIRRRARAGAPMFRRLRLGRFLKATSDEASVTAGFHGRAGGIASVHQHGRRDRVDRRPGSPEVTYAARRLLGLTDADRDAIRDVLAELLSGGR